MSWTPRVAACGAATPPRAGPSPRARAGRTCGEHRAPEPEQQVAEGRPAPRRNLSASLRHLSVSGVTNNMSQSCFHTDNTRALGVACLLWVGACLASCVSQDTSYQQLVAEYAKATPFCAFENNSGASEGRVAGCALTPSLSVTISPPAGNSDVTVKYSDETRPRRVSMRRDYSNIQDVRLRGSFLYAGVTYDLLWSESWIFKYDLANRRSVNARRVLISDISVHPSASHSCSCSQ